MTHTPTKPGYYWHWQHPATGWRIKRVFLGSGGVLRVSGSGGFATNEKPVSDYGGKWDEHIPEPTAPPISS